MRILLPWPNSKLSPNARTHYAPKAKIAAEHKTIAYYAAKPLSFSKIIPQNKNIPMVILFHAPDRRARDIDNIYSSCKAYLDGIALALGVNDKFFRPVSLDWAPETFKHGQVEIIFDLGS